MMVPGMWEALSKLSEGMNELSWQFVHAAHRLTTFPHRDPPTPAQDTLQQLQLLKLIPLRSLMGGAVPAHPRRPTQQRQHIHMRKHNCLQPEACAPPRRYLDGEVPDTTL